MSKQTGTMGTKAGRSMSTYPTTDQHADWLMSFDADAINALATTEDRPDWLMLIVRRWYKCTMVIEDDIARNASTHRDATIATRSDHPCNDRRNVLHALSS